MIGLDRLMKRKGVVAAGEFADDGTVVRSAGSMTSEAAKRIARICAVHQHHAQETSKELNQGTPMNWRGLNGWLLWSGDYALCVSGHTGVFVKATEADFNQLLVDLFGPAAAGVQID